MMTPKTETLVGNVLNTIRVANRPQRRLPINKGIKFILPNGEVYVPSGLVDYPKPGEYYLSPYLNVILTSQHVSRKHLILKPLES